MTAFLAYIEQMDWVLRYVVVLLRTSGLFIFLPLLSSRAVPARIRMTIAMAVALALVPIVPLDNPAVTTLLDWGLLAICELLFGLLFGIGARVTFAIAETASAVVAGQSGFAIASMIDPNSGDPSIIPATFHALLASTLFFSANLHHLFIRGLVESYAILPATFSLPDFAGIGDLGLSWGSRFFLVAIELAAPAMLVSITADLVMALAGKAMPQVPILMVGYPVKMAIGLVAMVVLTYAIGGALGTVVHMLTEDTGRVAAVLAGN